MLTGQWASVSRLTALLCVVLLTPVDVRLLDRLSDHIKWTTDLGNAFLDQQSEVMDASQRMRQKAKSPGKQDGLYWKRRSS